MGTVTVTLTEVCDAVKVGRGSALAILAWVATHKCGEMRLLVTKNDGTLDDRPWAGGFANDDDSYRYDAALRIVVGQ